MDIITIVQIVSAIFLVVFILLQQRGNGLSGAIGGGGNSGASYSTRRGLEKHIFRATIVLAIIFFGAAIMQILR